MAPTTYSGITFPDGDVSFADFAFAYDPAFGGGAVPTASQQELSRIVGAPNNSSVSLGDGGRITVRFDDNVLTGSGDATKDLHIFEVGPDVEDCFVEISADGTTWISVGAITGSTSSIDIDPFIAQAGFSSSQPFRFVRITDDGDKDDQSGSSVGADIEAVGAISSIGRIAGTNGSEAINGSAAAEVIDAGGGADTVSAGGGNDTVNAGEGNDVVFGGAGIDVINGEGGDDQLFGGVAPEGDVISGGDGNDQVYANAGADSLDGGLGNDILGTGTGNDTATGGAGNDTLFGGGDTGADLLQGGDGNDIIFAGPGNDLVSGGIGEDEIGGGAGNDIVNGNAGNDTLYGGAGADTVIGGDNGDLIYSGTGDDTVFLGEGSITPSATGSRDGDRDVFGAIANNGNDLVYGFERGIDDIDLSAVSLNSFGEVSAALTDSGSGVVLDLGAGSSLTLAGVTKAELSAGDFIF